MISPIDAQCCTWPSMGPRCPNLAVGRNEHGVVTCKEHGALDAVAVIAARVNWHDGWANDPTLEVLLNRIPAETERTYHKDDWLYYGDVEGVVRYFSYRTPGDGFGGAHFQLPMDDGTVVELIGPWLSNAGAVNARGSGPIVDVSVTTDPAAFDHGAFRGGLALTVPLAMQALRCLQGVSLLWMGDTLVPIKTSRHRQILGQPTLNGDSVYDELSGEQRPIVFAGSCIE